MALTKVSGSVLKDPLSLGGEVSIGGTLTYQDVTNVDAIGIITARAGVNVSAGEIVVGSNIKIGNAGIITASGLDISGDIDVDGHTNLDNVSIAGVTTFTGAIDANGDLDVDGHTNLDNVSIAGVTTFSGVVKIPTVVGTNTNANLNVLFQTASGVIDGGSQLTYNPGGDSLSVNGNFININTFRGAGSLGRLTCANHSSTTTVDVSNTVDITTVDNTTGAFTVKEGSNEYITVDTTNSSELIKFGTAGNERLRITSGGDLLLGGHSAYTYDDTGASNVILDIYGGATAGKRGILSLSGRTGNNNADLGTIWFNNDNNSGASPSNNMKLAAAIQAKSVTSDSNAQNDSGAYLQFFTKAESGSLSERVRILSNGRVHIRPSNTFYAMNSQSTDLVIGDGGGGRGITFWTAGAADNQTISFQTNETLSRAEGEISYGPTATSTVADRNAMMFRVNSAERLRITSTGNTRIGVPPTTGSSSLISEKQATIGTKHFYTVYHNFSSTNSPLAVNSKIPHPACGTVEVVAGWSNGNGLRLSKFHWTSSGSTSGCVQIFTTTANRYGVSVSIGTPTMSISGDYTNFSFTFSDTQGSKMEKLKIHFEYFNQFRIDG